MTLAIINFIIISIIIIVVMNLRVWLNIKVKRRHPNPVDTPNKHALLPTHKMIK